MQRTLLTRTLLATTLALAFGASAQSDNRTAKEKELEAARAELQKAAKRVAELSREVGRPGEGAFVFEHRLLRKPVLGVLLDEDAAKGVRVSGVTPDSGAAKAGLRSGDRIVSIDGKPVAGTTPEERLDRLREMLEGLEEGKAIGVGYERDGRSATASVTPAQASPVAVLDMANGEVPGARTRRVITRPDHVEIDGRRIELHRAPGAPDAGHGMDGKKVRVIRHDARGVTDGETRMLEFATPGIAPEVHREVIRLARDATCKDGKDCRTVALTEAFRWNGLNLASVDTQLGRYFGTNDGVLIVSAGPDLAGLQSGDVIRKVDGRAVSSPREVMDVLRTKPEGAVVAVDYLRDRKPGTAQVKAPKAMRIPLPPTPPAPPAPPAAPAPSSEPAPPPPPAPASLASVPRTPRLAVAVAPPPPAPPAPPAFVSLPRVD